MSISAEIILAAGEDFEPAGRVVQARLRLAIGARRILPQPDRLAEREGRDAFAREFVDRVEADERRQRFVARAEIAADADAEGAANAFDPVERDRCAANAVIIDVDIDLGEADRWLDKVLSV